MVSRPKQWRIAVTALATSAVAFAATPAMRLSPVRGLIGWPTCMLALVLVLLALLRQVYRGGRVRRLSIGAALFRSQFLANVSHELRTPLNGILGMAELLAQSSLDADQREMVDMIRGSSEGLLAIVNDILDYARIDAARLRIEEVPFELSTTLHEICGLFEWQAMDKGLAFHLHLAPELPRHVITDPLRLRQILVNLIGNAVKFTEAGSVRVEVELAEQRAEGLTILCRVVDTGIGIDPGAVSRIFAPFVQADSATTRQYGGTGLGLAICRRLLDLLGGKIGVESQPGEGSTFWFLLPVKRAPAFAASTAGPLPPGRRLVPKTVRETRAASCTLPEVAPPLLPAVPPAGRRVLIVEDNPINQIVALRAVTSLGYEAELAAGGSEALAAFANGRFDAILMDCQMPGMDGYHVAAEIRRHEAAAPDAKPTPIIAMTANAVEGDQLRCVAAGMNDYLPKPIRLATLARALECWTGQPVAAPPAMARRA